MKTRDLAILKHIALYRISLRPVLERLFFDGRSCGNVVHRLVHKGFLWFREGLPGGYSYYQLAGKGASLFGLPDSRTTPFGFQALHSHISILWFCCMTSVARYRVEPDALKRFFGSEAPDGDHCLEAPLGRSGRTEVRDDESQERAAPAARIYHLYVPGPDTKPPHVVRQIRKRLETVRRMAEPSRWMEAHRYAFATLVETDARRLAVRDALRRASDEHGPLLKQAYVRVEVVPGYNTIKEALSDSDE